MTDPARFPDHFLWGVATAAPQIEGAATADGKGPSIWDLFSRVPGRIRHGDTPAVACDHYHRFREDFALMASLGLRHYRLSIAWPRIYPLGRGAVNPKGIDFYHRLFAALEENGITPHVTMFHWDLPAALEAEGGWRVRGIVDAFGRYADTIVRAFGERVKRWITLNEISCFTTLAYGDGIFAPGAREGPKVVNQTYHHALLCHGEGVRAVREWGGAGARVGLTDNPFVTVPATETEPDIAAAERLFTRSNWRVLDAVCRGRYDPEYLAEQGAAAPVVAAGDFAQIAAPTDFLGLNLYTGHVVRRGHDAEPEVLRFPPHYPQADSPWLNWVPRALYWGPRMAAELYGCREILITENGAGYDEAPPANGEVLDLHRLEYVRACLRELRRGIGDGFPVRGYFLWSFLDNFEWADGYQRRFGICYTDFATQRRTPKASARWYSEVVRRNALV